MRYLPIIEKGEFRPRANIWALCYLAYPENEQEALRAAECLLAENEAMEAGEQNDYGEIGNFVRTRLTKRMHHARIAGHVLYQMVLNKRHRGSPDFRKAVFSVSEWASVTRTGRGTEIPSSGDNLRKHFKEYFSALHFWAALDLLPYRDLLNATHETPSFYRWMMTAGAVQDAVEEYGLVDGTEAMKSWNPWRVPEVFVAARDYVEVHLPDETEEIRARLDRYVWKPFDKNPRR